MHCMRALQMRRAGKVSFANSGRGFITCARSTVYPHTYTGTARDRTSLRALVLIIILKAQLHGSNLGANFFEKC